jgi:hypothetical protein
MSWITVIGLWFALGLILWIVKPEETVKRIILVICGILTLMWGLKPFLAWLETLSK